MQTIYRGNKTFQQFDFQQISLSSPIRVGNGNYFMKYKANDQSLYVQPPQCISKQGIINVSKKHYIDLLFTNEDADFIQWMEKLEETSVNYIYNNRVKWFDGDMEKDDIENYFSSPFRIFRSGKYYILRVSIATTLGLPAVKVYDSDENEVSIDDINDTTQVMCILEIKGIKCGTRNFQIEMETKQLMIMKSSNPFDKCLFQTDASKPTVLSVKPENEAQSHVIEPINTKIPVEDYDVIVETVEDEIVEDTHSIENVSKDLPEVPLDNPCNLGITENSIINEKEKEDNSEKEKPQFKVLENKQFEGGNIESAENAEVSQSLGEQLEIIDGPFDTISNDMEEVSFPLEKLENMASIQLREPNDIYYEMYYEARRKAKMAKEMALSCYLEAKNIKNTYMLNDLHESDSDENISEP